MAVFLLLWFVIYHCAHAIPKSRAKIVEEYVVSAKLDEKKNFPQIQQRSQLGATYLKDGTEAMADLNDASSNPALTPISHASPKYSYQLIDDLEDRNILEDRDLLVHHHLPPPSPPPPPPPPIGLHYAPSFFAIGLITFLLLLNSLQTSLLILKSKGSVLGSVTGALGRRKRFAVEDVYEHEKLKPNFMSKGR